MAILAISRLKGKQTMKLSQLIEYNRRSIFLKKHAENKARRLVLDLFIISKKTCMSKNKWSAA